MSPKKATGFMAAIDPLALILPNEIYQKLTAPRPQLVISEAVKDMTLEEKQETLGRIQGFRDYLKECEAAVARSMK
jgi:hypothetical protein